MQQYNCQNGQSWYDVCLNTYGSLDYLGKLVSDNGGELNVQPTTNTVIYWDQSLVKDSSLLSLIKNNGYVYNTGVSIPLPYIQKFTAGTSTIDFTNNGGDDWTVGFKIAVNDLPSGWSVVNYDYNVTFAEGGNYTLIESGTKTSDYDVTSNLSGNGAGVYALSCQYNMTDGINNLYILMGNLIKVDASGNILGAIENNGMKVNSVNGLDIDYTAYVTQIGVSEIINVDAIDANTYALTNLSHSLNDTVTLPIGTGGVAVYTDLDNTFWTDLGSLVANPFQLGNFYITTIS